MRWLLQGYRSRGKTFSLLVVFVKKALQAASDMYFGLEEGNTRFKSIGGAESLRSLTGGLDFFFLYACFGCDTHRWSCTHGGSCFLLLFLLY